MVVPDMPELELKAKTLSDIMLKGNEEATSLALDMLEKGLSLPNPRAIESVQQENSLYVIMLMLDLDSYIVAHERALDERKVSLKKWLAAFADKNKTDLSAVLEEALVELYKKKRYNEDSGS
jgi:hypothetical protein